MYNALSMDMKSKNNCLNEISNLFFKHQILLQMLQLLSLFIYFPYPWERGKKNPENS